MTDWKWMEFAPTFFVAIISLSNSVSCLPVTPAGIHQVANMAETTLVSFAQFYEDIVLYAILKDVKGGTYIDVGAQDPIIDSVTKLFYGRGWHGINIEPVSYWYKRICIDRPRDINLQVAASSTSGVVRLYEVADTGLSTAIREFALQACSERGLPLREYDVPTQTLDAICAEHNVTEVHFLKIDAEGYEPEILRGFGFSKVRPWVVVVESVNPNSRIPSYKTWEPGLIERGYECVHWDGLNRFYLAKEHAELKAALDPPPNPAVMGVVRAAEARLLRLANARQFELGGVEVSTSGKFVSLFIKAMRVAHREGLSQMIRKTMRYLARRILSS